MPITQTITLELPTYDEVRQALFDQNAEGEGPSYLGMAMVAAFQQPPKHDRTLPYLQRRENLLAARAKWSWLRHRYPEKHGNG